MGLMNLVSILGSLRNKYQSLSAPFKASMWFLVCSVVVKCFSMVTTPIFTRILTLEQYGQTANFYSWYDLLYPFITLYLSGVAYNNVLVKYDDRRDEATFSLMTLATLITTCFLVIYLVDIDFWNTIFEISTPMMLIMFMLFLSFPIFDFWSAKERFDYKYKNLVFITISNTLVSLVISVILVLNVESKYEARVAPNIILTAIIGFLIYINAFKKNGYRCTTKYWKYALLLSIPLIPHYLSIKVLNQVDRVMITKLVGLTETGLYSLAYTIASLMIIVTDAINRSLCPYIYKSIKEGTIKQVGTVVNGLITVVLLVSFLEMLLAPELIGIFATQEYMDAVYIIPPVALSVFFTFVYVIYSNVEFYYEKTIFATVVSILAAITNIALNYLLIPIYGYYAAGFTTLLCYILFALLHYLNYRRLVLNHKEIQGIYNNRMISIICTIGIFLMLYCIICYKLVAMRYLTIIAVILSLVVFKNKITLLLKFKYDE